MPEIEYVCSEERCLEWVSRSDTPLGGDKTIRCTALGRAIIERTDDPSTDFCATRAAETSTYFGDQGLMDRTSQIFAELDTAVEEQ